MNTARPTATAQHKTVIEATSSLLGNSFKDLILQFERMRRKRNDVTYRAGALLSKSETENSLNDAIDLVKGIIDAAKRKNPQMRFGFNL